MGNIQNNWDKLVDNWDEIFFGLDNFKTTNGLEFKLHSVEDVIKFGQKKYYNILNLFTLNPYDVRVSLYNNKLDYIDYDEYDIFIMLWMNDFHEEVVSEDDDYDSYGSLFKFFIKDSEYDFIYPTTDDNTKSYVIKNNDGEVIINRYIYNQISNYLKRIHLIKKDNRWKKFGNKQARDMDIRRERDRIEIEERRGMVTEYPIKKYVSSLVWGSHSGNDYNSILKINIWQLYDAIVKVSSKENADNLNYGIYSGSVDYKKIDKSLLNWID